MYRIDISNKKPIKIQRATFSEIHIKERQDLQEWIDDDPEIIESNLLIIAKEFPISDSSRLDLLAIDRTGKLVVIELKTDQAGKAMDYQASRYASYVSRFDFDRIVEIYREYSSKKGDTSYSTQDAETDIKNFIDPVSPENVNDHQRIILVAKEFHPDLASAVFWLRDNGIEIRCVKLTPYFDKTTGNFYLDSRLIIPLPELTDFVGRKERAKNLDNKTGSSSRSVFDEVIPNYTIDELKVHLKDSLLRESNLTERLIAFFEKLLSEEKAVQRDSIKSYFVERNIASDTGYAGRLLSNISQFITKPANGHLRQILRFDFQNEIAAAGAQKDAYQIRDEYRKLVKEVLSYVKIEKNNDEEEKSEY